MDANEYQRLALRTEKTPHFVRDPADGDMLAAERMAKLLHALLGLYSEGGEFADALKKHLIYGAPLDITNVMEEMGDKLWYIALALHATGYTMGEAMERNIAKLRARYPEGFTEEKALGRDLDAERAALATVARPDAIAQERKRWEASRHPNAMTDLMERAAVGLCTCQVPRFVGNGRCDYCGRRL